jgi:hypothetical protein
MHDWRARAPAFELLKRLTSDRCTGFPCIFLGRRRNVIAHKEWKGHASLVVLLRGRGNLPCDIGEGPVLRKT